MVDLYCERVGAGLFAEPLNVLTNAAFLMAALAAWALARRSRTLTPGTWTALGLLVAIAAGSTLFHMLATTWARVLDVVPILLFQLTFLWLYGRNVVRIHPGAAAGTLALFLAAALVGRMFPQVLNGSLTYAPAVLLLAILGTWHVLNGMKSPFSLFAAAGTFVVAVGFRSIDIAACSAFPVGTHFLWHLLVPVVLYLSLRALLLNSGPAEAKAR
jgi:hypothetical protein